MTFTYMQSQQINTISVTTNCLELNETGETERTSAEQNKTLNIKP